MTEDFELIMSPLCQILERDGKSVQVDIYNGDNGGWALEVEDQYGNSTIWDDEFASDQEALDEAIKVINDEGIETLIGNPS